MHLDSESFGKQPENGRVPSALLSTGSEKGIFYQEIVLKYRNGTNSSFRTHFLINKIEDFNK